MLRKWWVNLLQGIFLVILGIYIFQNPAEALTGISLVFGILILVTGLAGIFAWLLDKERRENGFLLWSILTALFGLLIVMHLVVAVKFITIMYGIWVLLIGFNLVNSGWRIRKETIVGWIMFLVGLFSIFAGIKMVFNLSSGIAGSATIIGLQALLAGICLMLFAFAKKMVVGRVRSKLQSLIGSED